MSEDNKKLKEKDEHSTLVKKRIIAVCSIVIFLAVMIWAAFRVGIPLVEEIFGKDGNSSAFTDMVQKYPVGGRLLFIGIQILQVFVAIIPGEAVEIAAGLAFGTVGGLVLSLIGVAIGSSIIFLLSKTLGMKFVRLFVDEEKINNLKFIRTDKRLNELTFLIFLIPGTPKDVFTYIIGLTRMKLHTFLAITLTARIPSILSSTWGGDALIGGEYTKAVIIFGAAAVLSAIGLIIYGRISAKKSANAQTEEDSHTAQEASQTAENKSED